MQTFIPGRHPSLQLNTGASLTKKEEGTAPEVGDWPPGPQPGDVPPGTIPFPYWSIFPPYWPYPYYWPYHNDVSTTGGNPDDHTRTFSNKTEG